MRHADLLDYWKRLARLRNVPVRAALLEGIGFSFIGAGLGAIGAGTPSGHVETGGFLLAGVLSLFGSYSAHEQRTDTADAICCDFEDFIARWLDKEKGSMGEEYAELLSTINERRR